jgi:signal transduction histidine kinase
MAEIASEVLHNVGNAVNTANCCAELVEDRLNESRVSGLEMATLLLSEQAPRAAEFFSQDPRGPKLVNYLIALNGTLQKERSDNLAEVRRLQETIRHIRDTIASQQEYARHSDFRQRVDLRELIDETLLVNAPLQHQAGVQVQIEAEAFPEVLINRSRVSQVLVNIQKNAILSMQSLKGHHHVMTIELAIDIEGALLIRISDTGQGFTPEVKARLFAQGFTTRSSGSGVGLHYCANVIREMGGEITAESDGPGLGARFQIRIPRAVRALPAGEFSASDQTQPSLTDFGGQLEEYRKEEQFV